MELDTSIRGKNIMVAPLCWGLGHAARCVPIVHRLLEQENNVLLASDSEALDLLRLEFPQLKTIVLPAYDITYKHKSMMINMLLQAPKILSAIKAEKKAAEKIAKEYSIDIIISDNRLGFRSAMTRNIYLTHQINILANNALASKIATKVHAHYYKMFEEIWIPDYNGEKSLGGLLSQSKPNKNYRYIGPVSRLEKIESEKIYDTLIILSGPEPQRTQLEEILIKKTKKENNQKICLVRGVSSEAKLDLDHVTSYNFVDSRQLSGLIAASEHIICRSGYTSIMDLVSLGRGATLIPTPGQTEQEYLAEYLDGRFVFNTVKQKEITKK